MNLEIKDLLDAGVHFGHQLKRWNPRSKPFVYDHRHDISIIDLEKTYQQLEKSCAFLEGLVASGKDVLLVGTKKQSQEIIREAATSLNMPFCANRWMGGTLTNFVTIKKSLEKYRKFLKMEEKGELAKLSNKKELAAIRREMSRMYRNFEGLKDINDLPAVLFVVDIKHEQIAVNEAKRLGIPVVALVDTNSDPFLVDYPIPGNDDAVKAIRVIVETITEAIQNGLSQRATPSPQKGIKPIIRQDFSDVQPEVTLSPDINLDEQGNQAPQEPVTEAAPAKEAAPATETTKE